MTSAWEGRLSAPFSIGNVAAALSRDFGLAKTALSRGLDRNQFVLTESKPLSDGRSEAPIADPAAAGPLQGRPRLLVLSTLRLQRRANSPSNGHNAVDMFSEAFLTVPALTLVVDAFDCNAPLTPVTAEAAGRRPSAQQAAVMRERDRYRGSKRRDSGVLSSVMSMFDGGAAGSGVDRRHGPGRRAHAHNSGSYHAAAAVDGEAPLLIARLHPALLSDAAAQALVTAPPLAAGDAGEAARPLGNSDSAGGASRVMHSIQVAREAWAAWCEAAGETGNGAGADGHAQPDDAQLEAASDFDAAFEEFAASAAAGAGEPQRRRGPHPAFGQAAAPGRPPRPADRGRERDQQQAKERERERQLQRERQRSRRELLKSVGSGVGAGVASPARDRDAQCGSTRILPARDFEAWLRPALQPSLAHVLSVLATQHVAALTLSCDGMGTLASAPTDVPVSAPEHPASMPSDADDSDDVAEPRGSRADGPRVQATGDPAVPSDVHTKETASDAKETATLEESATGKLEPEKATVSAPGHGSHRIDNHAAVGSSEEPAELPREDL